MTPIHKVEKTDQRNYVEYFLGHLLNNMDSNIERIDAIIKTQSDKWLVWNEKVVGSLDPAILPEHQYDYMVGIYKKVGQAFWNFKAMSETSFKLILENVELETPNDIQEKLMKCQAVKTAMVKKASYEGGWHSGRVLWNNIKALLDLLKLSLNALRKSYDAIRGQEIIMLKDIKNFKKLLKLHILSMGELISNFLFSLDKKLAEVILEFKKNVVNY